MFKKILIANRSEIAVRVIKACREIGIKSVAVYSDVDSNALHVRLADESVPLYGNTAIETYLNFEKIVDAAKKTNCEAIHPGYGFLSENSEFIRYVTDSGLKFIGPSSESVKLMGNKIAARELMKKHNVPIVPGVETEIDSKEKLIEIANQVGYPLLIKAAAGGGGKGMRVVNTENDLIQNFELAQNEAEKAFKDKSVYIEKFIANPKHIEVQVLADEFGNYRHLFERECSLQRRHQKIIEEAPSVSLNDEQRNFVVNAAIKAAKACGYFNIGTVEFLFDGKNFYFLEMNTRVQVEHPITEMITGFDIVKEQIRIAAGNKISFEQSEVIINGASIEARIYAENPYENFMPSFGTIKEFRAPFGPGIRFDTGIDQYSTVPVYYDPILAKLIAWGRTRDEAINRLIAALKETIITGVVTNIPFNLWLVESDDFRLNKFNTQYIMKKLNEIGENSWAGISEEEINELTFILDHISKQTTVTNKFTYSGIKSNWLKRRFER